jgi:hypothetical protein
MLPPRRWQQDRKFSYSLSAYSYQPFSVIPAKAGMTEMNTLDSGFRRNDGYMRQRPIKYKELYFVTAV